MTVCETVWIGSIPIICPKNGLDNIDGNVLDCKSKKKCSIHFLV